ncbi:MAG TPA: ABC transporter permease [Anaerolineales bacterium]|nr:ABC transporter permease [Anaerolineales bacterium]
MRLALRNLFKESTRLALSVGGMALAVMLILILRGFRSGMYRQITSYLDHSTASVVVAQRGVNNLLGATSLLPPDALQAVESVEGVEMVVPILSQFVILDLHGKKQPAYMIGYDPETGGGPWELAQGREPTSEAEVVFDRALAERHDLRLGDAVEIMGRKFELVGFSQDTTSWMTSFFFLPKAAVEGLVRAPRAASFLLVSPASGVAPETLRQRLDDLPGAHALLKSEVEANDLRLFARFFSAPVQLMVGIAFLVGVLVVGLVIYTATVERQREYGVLKALGARNGLLYRVVGAQALIAAAFGVLLGVVLAYAASRGIMAARPQFLIVLEPTEAATALVAGLAMALVAALLPARLIAGLAPAEVFRR